MKCARSRNNEMYLSEWYNNYLMSYVRIISHPKYTHEQRVKYYEILLAWYENFNGYLEEYDC